MGFARTQFFVGLQKICGMLLMLQVSCFGGDGESDSGDLWM